MITSLLLKKESVHKIFAGLNPNNTTGLHQLPARLHFIVKEAASVLVPLFTFSSFIKPGISFGKCSVSLQNIRKADRLMIKEL